MQPHAPLTRHYSNDREKPEYVRQLFDSGAKYYDRTVGWGFFGSGRRYRRWAQQRHGLKPGMSLLDVASGTGLMAEAAADILGTAENITCLDPSPGMLSHVKAKVDATIVVAGAEKIPLGNACFDFLTMGYALRHVTSLDAAFGEYFRVLKPGGRVLILEVTKPERGWRRPLFDLYFRRIYPMLTRIFTGSGKAREMMQYYWETMDAMVTPTAVVDRLQAAGFTDVKRHCMAGIFSEYSARKPD